MIVVLLLGALAVVGCQTEGGSPSISLEDAKKTVTSLKSGELLMPPRRANDVLKLVDNWPDDQSSKRSELLAIVNHNIPEDASKHSQITSLYGRASAARKLGRSGQELEDLRRAIRLTEASRVQATMKLGPIFEKYLYRDAAWAEFTDGNFDRSQRYFRHATQLDPGTAVWENDVGGWTTLAGLAYVQAYSGDLISAKKTASEALDAIKKAGRLSNDRRRRYDPRGMHRLNPWRRIYPATIRYSQLQAQGRWKEAEPEIRKAIEIFDKEFGNRGVLIWDHGRQDDWIDLQRATLARNLAHQGRIRESELVLRDALRDALEAQGKFAKSTALILSGFHEILASQGRYSEAEYLARRIMKIYETLKIPPGSLLVGEASFQLAEALALQSRWHKARDVYKANLDAISPGAYSFQRRFSNDPSMLLSLLEAGELDTAASLIDAARIRSDRNKGPAHYDSFELGALNAMLASKRGDHVTAIKRYREAVPDLIAADRRARVSGNQRYDRRWRLLRILKDYISSLERSRATDDKRMADGDAVFEAFQVAAFAQSHEVDWALAKSSARNLAADPELVEIIRLEQDAKLQIESVTARLVDALTRPSAQQNKVVVSSLRARLSNLENSRFALRSAIEDRYSDYANLIAPEPPTLLDIRKILRPDEAILSFIVGDDRTYVWAFGRSGDVRFKAVDLGRQELAAKVGLLRVALEPKPKVLGDIPEFDTKTAYELYAALLEPLATGWQGAKNLIVLADGPLTYLPFQLLVTKPMKLPPEQAPLFSNYKTVPWLARTHSVTTLPSANSLQLLRKQLNQQASTRPFVGFGDPVFSTEKTTRPRSPAIAGRLGLRGGTVKKLQVAMRAGPETEELTSATIVDLPRLPETADEVRQIAKALKADPIRDVYAGSAASEARVKTMMLSDVRVLAFATHGLVPGDLNGLLEPALALTSSKLSDNANGKEDGLLQMGEILGLKLNADWVVLSACNTGADKSAGAGAVSGLGRAFFYAGARALLVTNWPVETNSTKLLTTTLFKMQSQDSTLTRTAALRQARLRLIDGPGFVDSKNGKEVFAYSHPIFWAAFTLIGDGGKGG